MAPDGGQRYDRVTPAMTIAVLLAARNRCSALPDRVRWHLGAYTSWNVTLLLARHISRFHEWDPFLCVNSVAILIGFRTAFANSLADNIRKKLVRMGHSTLKSKAFFHLGDVLFHVLPAVFTTTSLLLQKKRVPREAVTHSLTLGTWFAFCQTENRVSSDYQTQGFVAQIQ